VNTVWLGLRVALVVLAVLLVGCSGDDDVEPASPARPTTEGSLGAMRSPTGSVGSTVEIVLAEWAVKPRVGTVARGEVTFKVSNAGTVPHELVIVRTDLATEALPVSRPVASGTVDKSQVDVIGRVDRVGSGGETKEGTFALGTGSYVLICDMPAHYGLGMRVAFRVE
jgi:uncharacterized cupredoxin-like copper-binding protein